MILRLTVVALSLLLFLATAAGVLLLWNRWFQPVSTRVAALLVLAPLAYLAPTMFSSRMDMPANLAFVAYPWQATGGQTVQANTGIVFAQLAPWSAVARRSLRAHELPFWNRASASGAPLLANQQTAIFHPFTLLGLALPLGKAFTLSSALRLFFVAFFTFLLLRNLHLSDAASVVGSLAFTFCSFHVVWLLFPLGLSSMMLAACLVGVQELARQRLAGYLLLVGSLALSVLGGHPESALWVWIATAVFATCTILATDRQPFTILLRLATAASAFVIAMLLTAWWWYPTLGALRETSRFNAMQSLEANPADHGLSREWLLPLVAPNVLGNPANGTYKPPAGFHPAVLNDYGEVASSYAGLAMLGLSLAAPLVVRRRSALIFAVVLLFVSLATFGEFPVWRDALRRIPLVGISIHQRLRLFWDLGVVVGGAATLDAVLRDRSRWKIAALTIGLSVIGFVGIYAYRRPSFMEHGLGLAQCVVPVCACIAIIVAIARNRHVATVAGASLLIDLVVATLGYNPPARPADSYPTTGAIAAMQQGEKPYRIAALGWSLLPDTPGMYDLEDVKTTDPVQHDRYMRLLRGFLNIDPGSYDLEIRDVSQPFFDYLNIKYVYAPPGQAPSDDRLVKVYEGPDGVVMQNTRVLPRYFLAQSFRIEPNFDTTVARSVHIKDFWQETLVDHIPAPIRAATPTLDGTHVRGGLVRVQSYRPNGTTLEVESNGWNLLVSSDVHWPGWRAYWNGKRQPPVIVNGAFLGCFVPPGQGVLELRYHPTEFDHGLRAAGIGALVLLGIVLLWNRHARQKDLRGDRMALSS